MSIALDTWNISEREFPRTGTTTDQLKFLLNYAVLAPSGHNTQPWLFRIENETIELYADKRRALPIADPQNRELIISCGAALFNLRVALRHFGYVGKIQVFPNPNNLDLLASVRLGDWLESTAEDRLLFQAIPHRHTNRLSYLDCEIDPSLLALLRGQAAQENAWLEVVERDVCRRLLAELVLWGDRLQMGNPTFRQELSQWIHAGNNKSHDGIPVYAYGIDQRLDFATPIAALLMRTFDLGMSVGSHDSQLVMQSPAIAVLGTTGDTPADWLEAGQALERLLLCGQAVGLQASFFNQPIEIPELRVQLSRLLDKPGFPQILMRLGYAPNAKPTPRRTVDEVLLSSPKQDEEEHWLMWNHSRS